MRILNGGTNESFKQPTRRTKTFIHKIIELQNADEIINTALDLTVEMDKLPKTQREEVRKLLRKTPKF